MFDAAKLIYWAVGHYDRGPGRRCEALVVAAFITRSVAEEFILDHNEGQGVEELVLYIDGQRAEG